jgi:hypothetical protein
MKKFDGAQATILTAMNLSSTKDYCLKWKYFLTESIRGYRSCRHVTHSRTFRSSLHEFLRTNIDARPTTIVFLEKLLYVNRM